MLNDKKEETNKSVVINMLKDGETYEKMRYTGVTVTTYEEIYMWWLLYLKINVWCFK